jgi:hypothetical protein
MLRDQISATQAGFKESIADFGTVPRIAIEKKEKSRTPLGVMCYRDFGDPITPPER